MRDFVTQLDDALKGVWEGQAKMYAEIDRLTLKLSEYEERGERWKAEAMAARDMHRSNVTLGARDGTATFRKWHDARALNDLKEPSDPKPPA